MTSKTNLEVSLSVDYQGQNEFPEKIIDDVLKDLEWQLPNGADLYIKKKPDFANFPKDVKLPPIGGGGENFIVTEVIIPLVQQAGVAVAVITAIYKIIIKLIEKDVNCEVNIERNGRKITIKGHKIPKPEELIKEVFSDLDTLGVEAVQSKAKEIESSALPDLPDAAG